MRGTIALACALVVVFGCGKGAAPKPKAADCEAACAHMIDLAMQDIDKSAREAGGEQQLFKDLKAKAEASRSSDLATCQTQCMAGKVDTACARRAAVIDDVTTCTNRSGGLH
jgi:hypothetical protein